MAKKPKKTNSIVLDPLPIPCQWNCATCVQRIKPGDIVKIKGTLHQIAAKQRCACITTRGEPLRCEHFKRANKRVKHERLPHLDREVLRLVAEFRI